MKDISIKIINIILIIVTVITSIFSCVLLYYSTVGKNKIPTAVTSTYATTVTDPQTGEALPVIEANYYANKNNTGYEVVELLFNCYSGFGKQAIYSRGFQLCYDKDGNVVKYVFQDGDEYKDLESNVFQYNKYDNISFETGHDYSWGDPMFIDIDGKLYAVKLDGTYNRTYKSFNLLKSVWNSIKYSFSNWGKFKQESTWYDYNTVTYNYTFEDLLIKVGQILKSSSNGTGDSVISLIDLGDFLHIYDVDNNGQIAGEPLGVNTFMNSYFTMSTHYDQRGMVWANQSLFNSVAGNSEFNISGIETDVEYYKAVTQVSLTEKDFVERYVTVDDGYYYSLSPEKIAELQNFDNIEISITFDISNIKNKNVLGLDYYALNGIEVKSLTITSDVQRTFKLLVNSLKDTGLTEIITNNVTINNINSGVDL